MKDSEYDTIVTAYDDPSDESSDYQKRYCKKMIWYFNQIVLSLILIIFYVIKSLQYF